MYIIFDSVQHIGDNLKDSLDQQLSNIDTKTKLWINRKWNKKYHCVSSVVSSTSVSVLNLKSQNAKFTQKTKNFSLLIYKVFTLSQQNDIIAVYQSQRVPRTEALNKMLRRTNQPWNFLAKPILFPQEIKSSFNSQCFIFILDLVIHLHNWNCCCISSRSKFLCVYVELIPICLFWHLWLHRISNGYKCWLARPCK